MHNYTPEDLLRYLYREMSAEEVVSVDAELNKSWPLREKLSVMKTAQERLNNLVIPPRTEAVLNILKYAARTDTVKS